MQTNKYQSLKITSQNEFLVADNLVVEAPLQININNEPYTVVMRTPENDFDLVRGLLYAEDIYKKNKDLPIEVVQKENKHIAIVNVLINQKDLGKGYLNKRTLLSVSSCGICGKKELKDLYFEGKKLNREATFSALKIHEMHAAMKNLQSVFKKTGGSHAAAIFSKNNVLLTLKEDIGRHNAVDKCIGNLLAANNLQKAHYILVSGRVSYEIVSKAFIAKIPVIVAISACSSLAVDYAKEFGICLIGFTRDAKMTVYANQNLLK